MDDTFEVMFGKAEHVGTLWTDAYSDTVKYAIQHVRIAYDGTIKDLNRRRAPSIVWRNEVEFLGAAGTERWTTRVHLFEKSDPDNQRYIGYLNLRPPHRRPDDAPQAPLIADAMLTPPLRMTKPPYHIPTLHNYPQFYGIPHFQALPYSMPDPNLGGFCAQACIFIASVIMTRHGATPIAPFDASLLVHLPKPFWGPKSKPECSEFLVEGLTSKQLSEALSSEHVGTNVFCESCSRQVGEGRTEELGNFLNCEVRHYVEAGLPVILMVRPNSTLNYIQMGYQGQHPLELHALLIVGLSKGPRGLSFVYHDTAVAPYLETDIQSLINQLVWTSSNEDSNREDLHVLAVVPKQVKYPISATYPFLEDHHNWAADLVPKAHLHKRLMREWTQVMGSLTQEELREAWSTVRQMIPESDINDYSWFFTREHNCSETGRDIPMAYAIDATTLTPTPIASIHHLKLEEELKTTLRVHEYDAIATRDTDRTQRPTFNKAVKT